MLTKPSTAVMHTFVYTTKEKKKKGVGYTNRTVKVWKVEGSVVCLVGQQTDTHYAWDELAMRIIAANPSPWKKAGMSDQEAELIIRKLWHAGEISLHDLTL